MISSLSQHSAHRDVLLLVMPGVGQSAFLLSPLLSYKPSDSSLSMGCMLGFFLHCSAWLHYFILEAQELRGVCRTEDSKFLSKEPARPSPPICHQFIQSSACPEQKSQGLGESLSWLLFMFLTQEHFDHFTFNASACNLPPAFQQDQDLP